MGTKTGIEWTDATWNPLRGCSRVSDGCRNCYAEKVAYRFSGVGQPYAGLAVLKNGHASWTGKVDLVEKHLLDPLKWRGALVPCPQCGDSAEAPCYPLDNGHRPGTTARSRRIFVNSMSDVFHESVPDEWIDRIFAVMALCPQHTFQVLTKRPKRMRDYIFNLLTPPAIGRIATIAESIQIGGKHTPEWLRNYAYQPGFDKTREILALPNVWLGVSVENQTAADERIPLLLQTPAAVRFISAEPLLGSVDLDHYLFTGVRGGRLNRLHWVICGGESGPGARPMHPDWARSLRNQCAAAGVPFFFKQWGEWAEVGGGPPHNVHEVKPGTDSVMPVDSANCVLAVDGHRPSCQAAMNDNVRYRWLSRVGKHAAGALLDGVEHKEFPEPRG